MIVCCERVIVCRMEQKNPINSDRELMKLLEVASSPSWDMSFVSNFGRQWADCFCRSLVSYALLKESNTALCSVQILLLSHMAGSSVPYVSLWPRITYPSRLFKILDAIQGLVNKPKVDLLSEDFDSSVLQGHAVCWMSGLFHGCGKYCTTMRRRCCCSCSLRN